MTAKTAAKVQRELNSYQGLITLNIVFGALAMAFAISLGIQNIRAVTEAQSLMIPQITLITVAFVVAAVSIRWLISSAELLDGITDMKDEYNKNKVALDDEGIVSLVVKMTAHYRENKPKIKTMRLISKIGGACFLITGAYTLAAAVSTVTSGTPTGELFVQVLGSVFNFAMATASFAIPHFFGNYSKVWDYRLKQTAKAEEELEKQLEED